MLALLVLYFLASLGGYQSSQAVSYVQIGVTLLSLASGYAASFWVSRVDSKGVNLVEVINAM